MKTFKLLLQNLNETMPVETQLDKATKMGVIFINFTCIYSDRNEPVRKKKNEKLKGKSISKTSGRERVFKHKCFISNDSIYISSNLPYFYVKDRCKASMKKELMLEFNYVRGQVRCSKQDTHVLQGKVAIAIT